MITTHVLDTALGRPAAGVPVTLELQLPHGGWAEIGHGQTDSDGRLRTLTPPGKPPVAGTYRLTFATNAYLGDESFFPEVRIHFAIRDPNQHYHVPLLLSPFGYTTYRGS